jgi:transposase
MSGIIYTDVRKGAYDGDGFIQYIRELLEYMNPWPQPRSVLVLDNCRIHHVEEVEHLCTERYVLIIFFRFSSNTFCFDKSGVALYYLPAYSPDLNPIEEAFSFIKGYMRRNDILFRSTMQGRNEFAIKKLFLDALNEITPELASSWMKHSGYI